MFLLTLEEAEPMRSQTVTASKRNVPFQPYAFTEQGVSMLASMYKLRGRKLRFEYSHSTELYFLRDPD
jgi:ORF6N domain